jgi:hypothetical protein
MTDKEMIEEMAKFIPNDIVRYDGMPRGQHLYIEQKEEIAKELLNAGYRKIPEGSVVLSKEEYEKLCHLAYFGYEDVKEQARKETAMEILKWLVDTGMINIAPDTTKMYFKEQFGVEVE